MLAATVDFIDRELGLRQLWYHTWEVGCGMNAIRLSLTASELPDSLRILRNRIEQAIPVGFDMHDRDLVKRSTIIPLAKRLEQILDKHPAITKMQRKRTYDIWVRQLGRLPDRDLAYFTEGAQHFDD
jgi:RNA-splicing ligase RtcB